MTVTLTNGGTAALTISGIAISGTNAGDFGTTNNCAGSVAASGGSCTISVTFTPTASGARAATLAISDNAGNNASSQTVALSGTGTAAAAALAPSPLVFGSQNVGVSASQTITLSNSGNAALTIAGIAISGTNATDFGSTNNCAGSVAASSSCSIVVTFTPGAPGNRGALLTVTDNAGGPAGATQTVALTGVGVGVPTAGISTTSLTFGSIAVGITSAPMVVTLSNSGTGPLTISSIVIGGTNPGDFGDTTTCGASLAVGANCNISVTFKPTAIGARAANLHIVDNSGNVGSTQTVTLSGTGAAGAPPTLVSLSPTSGIGLNQTFTMVYSDPNGLSDLSKVLVLFNTSITASYGCYVTYTPGSNQMYLYNDAGTTLSAPVTPGSGTQVNNSQCTLNGTGSSYSTSGNNLTLKVSLTFAGTFTGLKNVYLDASGASSTSGWSKLGTWTAATAGPPTIVSLTPNSGTGLSQTFAGVYSDPNTTGDLSALYMLFNTSLRASSGCYVIYYPGTNLMYLYNNAGSGLTAGIKPGSASTINNSQCTLAGTGSSISTSGNNFTLNLALTFSGTFTGQQNVYMYALGEHNNSGWVTEGTWTP
jgi:hypothetical protein